MSDTCTHTIVLKPVTHVVQAQRVTHVTICPQTTTHVCIQPSVTSVTVCTEAVRVCVSNIAVLQQRRVRVVEVASVFGVPSNGILYLGTPPTTAAPLIIPNDGDLDTLTLSVDQADTVIWTLEVLDWPSLAPIASIPLAIGDTKAKGVGLGASITEDQQLVVRLSGSKGSTFANARATIEITQP